MSNKLEPSNSVLQTLQRIQRQRALEAEEQARAKATKEAQELLRANIDTKVKIQKKSQERDEAHKKLHWLSEQLKVGEIVVDLQRAVSGDSEAVKEEFGEGGAIIFKCYGGRQRGRKLESRQSDVGTYQPGWDFQQGSYQYGTVYFPGKKQEFENEVVLKMNYEGFRRDILGNPLDDDVYFDIAVIRYVPDKETDTFLRRGTLAPESHHNSGGFNSNELMKAREQILEVAARIAEECISKK